MNSLRTNNVMAYWIFTVFAALLFAVPGSALLLRIPHFTEDMAQLTVAAPEGSMIKALNGATHN